MLNFDINSSTPLLAGLHCVICEQSVIQIDFIPLHMFKICIMIVHTLKMCTGNAGPEQLDLKMTKKHAELPLHRVI